MGDTGFINGRAAVHKGSAGKAIAFPDVCLCPPGPPAGPVPVPLTNTVQAKDLAGGAPTVSIEGNPIGHRDSYFATSTGNEVAQSTGGGVITHVVQGKAYFQTFSNDVLIEGKPAVRHGDLLTQNHMMQIPGNTPPSVWMSTVSPGSPPVTPQKSSKTLNEGKDWIEIEMVDVEGGPVIFEGYRLTTPAGKKIDGRGLIAGVVRFGGLAKGNCQIAFPGIDEHPTSPGRKDGDQIDTGPSSRGKKSKADKIYTPGKPLTLGTGKKYRIELPRWPSYWLELTSRRRTAEERSCLYVLKSDDGKYQAERAMGEDLLRIHGALVLQFPDLLADKKYTLEHRWGKTGEVHSLFKDVPYERLRTRAKDAQDSEPPEGNPDTSADGVPEELRWWHAAQVREDASTEDSDAWFPGLEAEE